MRLRIVAVLGVTCACRAQPAPHAAPPPPPAAIVRPVPPTVSTVPPAVPRLTLATLRSPPTITGTGLRFVARRGDTTFRHGELSSIAVSRDGMFVATADLNGTIAVWDLRAGTVPRTIHTPEHGSHFAISDDGTALAAAAMDGTVRVWDVATGAPRWQAKQSLEGGAQVHLRFSPDGQELVLHMAPFSWAIACDNGPLFVADEGDHHLVVARGGKLERWDVAASKLVTSRAEKAVAWMRFAPDQKSLIVQHDDGSITVVDPKTLRQVRSLGSISKHPSGSLLEMSRDAKLLVAWTPDGLVLWRLSDGARVAMVTLSSPIEAPWAMTFSPDATRLYVGTTLGNVIVFDVVP